MLTQTIRPYSDPAQDLSEYPCVKHHFKMLEPGGSSVQCAKTGILWHPHEMDVDPFTQSIWFNKHYDTYTTDGLVTGGGWQPILEDEYTLQMFVVKVKDMQEFTTQDLSATPDERLRVRCRIGPLDNNPDSKLDPNFTGQKFGCSTRGGLHVALEGVAGGLGWLVASPKKLDTGFFNQNIAVVSKLYRTVADSSVTRGMDVYDAVGIAKSNSVPEVLTAYQTDVVAPPGNIYPSPQAGMTGGYFFGAAWFGFKTGYPADLAAAIKWMTASWLKGDRLIYPGWRFKQ